MISDYINIELFCDDVGYVTQTDFSFIYSNVLTYILMIYNDIVC